MAVNREKESSNSESHKGYYWDLDLCMFAVTMQPFVVDYQLEKVTDRLYRVKQNLRKLCEHGKRRYILRKLRPR